MAGADWALFIVGIHHRLLLDRLEMLWLVGFAQIREVW
jgi:hypothetical protein